MIGVNIILHLNEGTAMTIADIPLCSYVNMLVGLFEEQPRDTLLFISWCYNIRSKQSLFFAYF
jgi:hypothetical protein